MRFEEVWCTQVEWDYIGQLYRSHQIHHFCIVIIIVQFDVISLKFIAIAMIL